MRKYPKNAKINIFVFIHFCCESGKHVKDKEICKSHSGLSTVICDENSNYETRNIIYCPI